MAPPPDRGTRPRRGHRDPVRLRIRRPAPGPCLRRLFLPLGRRDDIPGQNARGVGGTVGVGEPVHDRVEPAGLPVHVLDRPRPPGGGHARAPDSHVSSGPGGWRSCLDGGHLGLHLPLHPGPVGTRLRALLRGVRTRAGSGDLGAGASGGLWQPDRGSGPADARAQRLLLRAGPSSLRVVGCLRRIRRRPHSEGDRAGKHDARLARRARVAGPGVDPPSDAGPDGRGDSAGTVLASGPTAWVGGGRLRVCDPRALRPVFISGLRRQPAGRTVDVPLKECRGARNDQPAAGARAATSPCRGGLARGDSQTQPRRPVPAGLASSPGRDSLPAQSGRRPATPLLRRPVPAARRPCGTGHV